MSWKKVIATPLFLVACAFVFLASPLAAINDGVASLLDPASKTFIQIAKKATPAVVFIKSEINEFGARSPEEGENPFDYFSDEFFRHFFGYPKGHGFKGLPAPAPQISGGSGFIVDANGYILTNFHVVKEASKITVVMNSGDEHAATLIGSDPRTDIAILKIEAKNLPCLAFGNSEELEIVEPVLAIGNPFALQATVTRGIISAKGRNNLRISDLEDFIQTDAAINPGNSGGPLLNIKGEVIGINTAIVSKTGGYMGIGFAIPSNTAKHVTEQIIKTGSVKRGYLGVFLQPIDKEMAEALNLEKTEGALISGVAKDSPAEKASLKEGDIIIEYNGRPIKNLFSFRNELALLDPGQKINLKVLRDSKERIVNVTLGDNPDEGFLAKQANQIGFEVSELKDVPAEMLQQFGLNSSIEGLIVTSVKRGSLAERAGLLPGMLVVQVNQKKVKTIKDFQAALQETEKKKHLLLLIRYQNMTKFITIKVG
ncbi:MAG: DegQ family serine endoprotease [Parachlamydiales bacterium]